MCRIDNADCIWDALRERRVVARKEHRCNECCRIIERGEAYIASRWVCRGEDPMSRAVCSHCDVACDWLNDVCNGFLFDMVREEIEEHTELDPVAYPTIALGRLAVGMRRQWRRRDGRLMRVPTMPRTDVRVLDSARRRAGGWG